jgi:hypothetical protein
MRADNTQDLIDAARRRRCDTLTRAQQTPRATADRGEPVTVAALAAAAGVSRSWLYAEPSLRPQLDALRHSAPRSSTHRTGAKHPASDASLNRSYDG